MVDPERPENNLVWRVIGGIMSLFFLLLILSVGAVALTILGNVVKSIF